MTEIPAYNLEAQPTTFDFATWACIARSNGFTKAAIKGTKFKYKKDYSDDTARRRLKNVVLPLAELAGLEIVEDGNTPLTHLMSGVQQCYRAFSRIWKYPYEKKHDHLTVTIRESWRNTHRNSNRKEWDKFISWAENNGEKVVVLEDREENPLSVKDRWDLYQCKMNLGVSNGPMILTVLSDAPHVILGYGNGDTDIYVLGVWHWLWKNAQYPWANRNQRIIWKPDTFETIQKSYIAASGAH